MRSYCIKCSVIIGILFCAFGVQAQESTVPTKKQVKIINNDTIILAELLVNSIPVENINNYKRYYWCDKNEIKSNIGGFHGRLLHGKFELFKSNNLVQLGQFNNGLKDGTWKSWRADGGYIEVIGWEDGLLEGESTKYHLNGNIKSIYNYEKGKKNGEYKNWNEKGEAIESGEYKDGQKHGKINFYENSKLTKTLKFRNGVEILPKVKKPKKTNAESSQETKKENLFNKLFKKGKDNKKVKKESQKSNTEGNLPFYKRWFKKKSKGAET